MATVDYWDAIWVEEIPGGNGRISLVLTGFPWPEVVGLTPYGFGGWMETVVDPAMAIENVRVTSPSPPPFVYPIPAFYFDLVNVGPSESVSYGTLLAFSFVSQ